MGRKETESHIRGRKRKMCNGTVYIASEDTKHKRVLIQVPPEITAGGGEGGENGSGDGEGGARGGGWRRSISSDLENISIKFVFSIINCQESFIKEKKNFQNKTIEVCKIDERKREIRGERDFDFAESRKMEKITLISVSVQTTDIQDILYPQYPFPLLTVKSEHFERKTPR
ncbi:hypothetical protein M8J75_005582 [Diaphorina citri]|nr:hypothetical protein M8J75_005582 [Diaphorina citri]